MNIKTWQKMFVNPKAKQRHQRIWMPSVGNVTINREGKIVGEIIEIEDVPKKGIVLTVKHDNGYRTRCYK